MVNALNKVMGYIRSLAVSEAHIVFYSGVITDTFIITVADATQDWELEYSASWFDTDVESGDGNTTITVTCDPIKPTDEATSRAGTITVSSKYCKNQTVNITQNNFVP